MVKVVTVVKAAAVVAAAAAAVAVAAVVMVMVVMMVVANQTGLVRRGWVGRRELARAVRDAIASVGGGCKSQDKGEVTYKGSLGGQWLHAAIHRGRI